MPLDLVVGARPNFMKAAALFRAAEGRLDLRLVHTGQHADPGMADRFLEELGLPEPEVRLRCEGPGHARQIASVLTGYAEHLEASRPRGCLVVGDVNSTLACALAASRAGVPLAHVEAGLRSFDRGMPEEVNRVLTDALSDLLFATEPAAVENLAREGRPGVHLVGNVMIDTLLHMLPRARQRGCARRLGLEPGGYAYLTLHRPENVDVTAHLAALLDLADWLADRLTVVFPVHPRTRARLPAVRRLLTVDPLPYLDSLSLTADARVVVTDSGGLQEEAAALGVPCVTVRTSTERPITVERGGNRVVGRDPVRFREAVEAALARPWPPEPGEIPLWDGRAAERIVRILQERWGGS